MIPPDLRALSLVQPMGWAIVNPHPKAKRIENRPQDLPWAMRSVSTIVAVHAGKKWSDEYASAISRILGVTSIPVQDGLIGLMHLSGRVFNDARGHVDPWYSGPFGYEIADAVALPEPIPCKGMLGFWRVPVELYPKLEDAYATLAAQVRRVA